MTNPVEIHTQRLCILPFQEKHLTTRYVSWLNDPEVVRYSEQRHRVHSLQSCRAYWESFAKSANFFWAIETLEFDWGHIGNINAYVDSRNRLADIGVLIGEKGAWRRGYGGEAFAAVCGFLFNACKLRKITAGTVAPNTPMLRIMQRSGMMPDGKRRRHFLLDGREVDVIHMAVFREQWE
jgi:RimJ/RimL family protein N-acetyltransferase